MNRFLTNINKIPITVKHLSGKYNLNTLSDHQNRQPPECRAETCFIHKLIQELTDKVLDLIGFGSGRDKNVLSMIHL